MKNSTTSLQRKRHLVCAVSSVLGLLAAMPALAETEIDGLKRELAEQKLLIQSILAAQGQQKPAAVPSAGANSGTAVASAVPAVPAVPVAPAKPAFTIYGIADVNVSAMDSGFGRKAAYGSGGSSSSRIGFAGERDLGDSLKAVYLMEAGLLIDTGSAGNTSVVPGINNAAASSGGQSGTGSQLFSRQLYAGVKGQFGALTIGRQYSGSYTAAATTASALAVGLYGYSGSIMPLVGGMPTRLNNSMVYTTSKWQGFSSYLTLTTGSENNINADTVVGTTTTTDKAGRGADLAVFYSGGPLNVGVSTWSIKNGSFVTGRETGLATRHGWQLAANYNFGIARVYAAAVSGRISGGNYENVTATMSDAAAWSMSAAVPFGKSSAYVTYTRLNDRSIQNKDAKLLGVGYKYTLLPETILYAAWGRVNNNVNASYSLADGGNLVGNVSKPGVAPSSVMVGVNQVF
jgi:predicted porin